MSANSTCAKGNSHLLLARVGGAWRWGIYAGRGAASAAALSTEALHPRLATLAIASLQQHGAVNNRICNICSVQTPQIRGGTPICSD